MVPETGFYELLGVAPDATPAEIRKGYRKAALRVHPDRAGSTAEAKSAATEAFQALQRAYATLYDAERRRIYDEFGAAGLEEGGAADASFARAGAGPRLTAEDIVAFERTYRWSAAETEDLELFCQRFAGDVRRVVHYIPFSENADLARFVDVFDELVAKHNAEEGAASWPEYKAARAVLLRRARRVAQRKKDDEAGAKGKGAKARKGKSKKAVKKEEDMQALVAKLTTKRAGAWGSFVQGLEDKYGQTAVEEEEARRMDEEAEQEEEVATPKKRRGRAKAGGSASASGGTGRVRKSRRKAKQG